MSEHVISEKNAEEEAARLLVKAALDAFPLGRITDSHRQQERQAAFIEGANWQAKQRTGRTSE